MSKQSVTSYLLSRGWERDDAPAEYMGECGASSDTVGYCEKKARWSRGGSGGHLCAQHAAQAQRLADAAPRPRISDEMSATATYFEVIPYVEADRSTAYAVQRTTYYVSDGAISEREIVSSHDSDSDAERAASRYDATYPGA